MKLLAVSIAIGFAISSMIARASADGDHDPTFNSGNTLNFPLNPTTHYDQPSVIGLTPSDAGGYIVTTTYYEGGNSYANDIIRLKADGSLDTELNSSGKFTVHGTQMYAMTTRSLPLDEMFLAGNPGNGDLVVCAYTGTGSKDLHVLTDANNCSTFAPGPFNVFSINPEAMAVQPWDGKIVIVGDVAYENSTIETYDMFALRLLADGEIDTAFGTNGMTHFPLISTTSGKANAVAFQSDHKIVIAGQGLTASNGYDFAAARLDADGTLEGEEEGTFPNPTERIYDFHGGQNFSDAVSDVQIDTAGRIYLVGQAESTYSTQFGSTYGIGIVRLKSDFTLDTSFLFGSPSLHEYIEDGSGAGGYEDDSYPGFALDSKSRLIIASGYGQLDAWRILPYGGSDASYNNGTLTPTGRVAVTRQPNGVPGEFPRSRPHVIVDSHDRPVIAGVTEPYGQDGYQLSIARLIGDDRIFANDFDLAPQ
jgi:uncharacterized delta-60 repeat protein